MSELYLYRYRVTSTVYVTSARAIGTGMMLRARWDAWRHARREARIRDAWPAPPVVPDWVMSLAFVLLVGGATWWGVGMAWILSWLWAGR